MSEHTYKVGQRVRLLENGYGLPAGLLGTVIDRGFGSDELVDVLLDDAELHYVAKNDPGWPFYPCEVAYDMTYEEQSDV